MRRGLPRTARDSALFTGFAAAATPSGPIAATDPIPEIEASLMHVWPLTAQWSSANVPRSRRADAGSAVDRPVELGEGSRSSAPGARSPPRSHTASKLEGRPIKFEPTIRGSLLRSFVDRRRSSTVIDPMREIEASLTVGSRPAPIPIAELDASADARTSARRARCAPLRVPPLAPRPPH